MQKNTLDFLGLTDDWADHHQVQWTDQRLRLANRQCEDQEAIRRIQLQKETVKKWRREVGNSRRRKAMMYVAGRADKTDVSRAVLVGGFFVIHNVL